jgi:amino acid transporter
MPKTINKFGTFKGVYLPSSLTILGVIMYLRMGWVAGHAGLWGSIAIVSIASFITFLTALSISAIATNMEVKGGGAYYMISRSFGPEAGAAVGLPLYLAQVIGVAFYIVGFVESLHGLLPHIPLLYLSLTTLVVLTVLAYISANLVLRAQLIILALIIASLVSLFSGSAFHSETTLPATATPTVSFWLVFAVFFPAVTGILSGVSLSGDLKDPRKSIPLGTMAAIITGFIIYLVVPIFLIARVPAEVLRTDMMILQKISLVPQLILIGIWGATLSSALSSMLGAPRTLQAMAQDRIVPAILGKSFGSAANPRIATAFSFVIAASVLFLGDLDTIAPILTMFLLSTYGILNLIAAVEAFMNNPSWRPVFKTHWSVPAISFLLCLIVMLMINPGATLIAGLIISLLFFITVKRRLNTRWDDMRHGLFLALARFSIYRLALFKPNVKSWRPNLLVLSGSPTQRLNLVRLGDTMTHGKGFLTVGSVVKRGETSPQRRENMEESLRKYLGTRNIPALSEITEAGNFFVGAKELVRTYGMGPLVPNTILMGTSKKPERFQAYSDLIQHIYANHKNLILFHEGDSDIQHSYGQKNILCWWRGKENNAGLMLTLSFMLQTSPEWRGANLYIKTIVPTPEAKAPMQQYLNSFLANSRIIASPSVLVESEYPGQLSDIIQKQSESADLVLLGLRKPGEDETPQQYAQYYARFLEKIDHLPPTLVVLAGEDVHFKDIFL